MDDVCNPISSVVGRWQLRSANSGTLCLVQGPPSAGVTSRCPGQQHGTDSRSNCGHHRFPLTHSQISSKLICLAASTSDDFCVLCAIQMYILTDRLIDINTAYRILFQCTYFFLGGGTGQSVGYLNSNVTNYTACNKLANLYYGSE